MAVRSLVLLLPRSNHKKDLCWQQMAEQSHSGFGLTTVNNRKHFNHICVHIYTLNVINITN